MKKKISLLLIAIAACLSLTACGKFTCDICGEEKSGKSYTTELFGEKIVMCSDCHDTLRALGSLFN